MCGIVAAADFTGKAVNNRIIDQYFKQKHRGKDGFGLMDMANKKLFRSPHESMAVKWLKENPTTAVLFHHRYPTSTANAITACHPFNTGKFFKNRYVLVHNGVLNNSLSLKQKHEEMGIVYTSVQDDGRFNDSEALMWDVALLLEGKQTELQARGSIAFICFVTKGGKDLMYFARNDRPLNLSLDEGNKFMLSSEGRGKAIKPHYLHEMDMETQVITERFLSLPTMNYYGNYSSGATYSDGAPAVQRSNFMGFDTEDDDDTVAFVDRQVEKWAAKLEREAQDAGEGSPVLNTALERQFHAEDIKRDIQNRYMAYMVQGEGYYQLAYEFCMEDKEWLAAAIEQEQLNDDPEGSVDDLFYELEIQGATMGAFLLTTEWRDAESRDEAYAKKEEVKSQLGLFAIHQTPKPSSTASVQEIIAGKAIAKKVKEIAAYASKANS